MNFKRLSTSLAAFALTATLVACGDSNGADATTGEEIQKLNVGTVGISTDAALKIAEEQGYFADENIEIETTVVANPPAGLAAAQSGELDIAYAPSIPLLNALSENVALQIVGAADGYPEQSHDVDPRDVDDSGLFTSANSGIDRPKDLEGRSVSVPARRAQLEVTISHTVKEDGGDPEKIDWMVLDPSSALQSLEQERVDAVGLVSPFTAKAEAEGNRYLSSPGVEFFGEGAVGLWVSGSTTVEENSEAIAGFQRAMKKANAYANENYEEAEKYASELTNVPIETMQQGAYTYWSTDITFDQIQQVNERLVNMGYLDEEVELDETLIFEAQ